MKVLLMDFNNILEDVAQELVIRGHEVLPTHRNGKIIDPKEADVIVVWQETDLGGWKESVRTWQKAGIKVILMQHGRRGTSRIFPPFNEKLVSDELCVWGENDVTRMVSCGVPREKIHVTGTSVLRHLLPRIPHKGINVVFSPEHWDVDVPENLRVTTALRKFVKSRKFWQKKVNVTSKLLGGEHNPVSYDNPVVSYRNSPDHLRICAETLQTADVVVAISESTFELMAQILDIPVIIADIWVPKACAGDDRYKIYQREYSDACERVKDLDSLGERILHAVSNPQVKRAERARIGILDGGMDIDDPVNEIIKVIEDAGNNSSRSSRSHTRRNTR